MQAGAQPSVGTRPGEAALSPEPRLSDGAEPRAGEEYGSGDSPNRGQTGNPRRPPEPGSLLPPFCQQEPCHLPTFAHTLHFPITPSTHLYLCLALRSQPQTDTSSLEEKAGNSGVGWAAGFMHCLQKGSRLGAIPALPLRHREISDKWLHPSWLPVPHL